MLKATKTISTAFVLLHLLCDMLFSLFHVFLIGDDYEKWFFILPFYSMNVTLIISPDMDPIHIEWTPWSWLRSLPQVVWNIKIVLKCGLVFLVMFQRKYEHELLKLCMVTLMFSMQKAVGSLGIEPEYAFLVVGWLCWPKTHLIKKCNSAWKKKVVVRLISKNRTFMVPKI